MTDSALPDRDFLAARIGRRITLFTLVMTLLAAVGLSLVTHRLIENRLTPELEKQSQALGEFAASDIGAALGYGIPLEELRGVEDHFAALRAPHPEIDFIALLSPDGRILQVSGQKPEEEIRQRIEPAAADGSKEPHSDLFFHQPPSSIVLLPVETATGHAATIAVGTDEHFTEGQLRELSFDVIVILIVAVFLSFEISVAVLNGLVTGPLMQLAALLRRASSGDLALSARTLASGPIGGAIREVLHATGELQERYSRLVQTHGAIRDKVQAFGARFGFGRGAADAGDGATPAQVRLALFVLVGADEMQKAFLPLYVRELGSAGLDWLPPEIMVGLPISLYMLALAMLTPFAGVWTDRLGARKVFLIGLIPAFVGFLGSALASSVIELTLSRCFSAAGYALCTIAAQGFILARTPPGERASGVSIFISVIMAANICGTAIGGILADLVGYRAVFFSAAILSVLASLLAWRMLPPKGLRNSAPRRGLRWSDISTMARNGPFMALLLLSAIPAKIVLTGFLFYAVPVVLAELGTRESEIARAMILYSLIIILSGPWFSRHASTPARSWMLVAGGTILSGAAILLLMLEQSIAVVVGCVAVIGISHAMSVSPQIALVPELCRKEAAQIGETAVLGVFRMLERIGSVIGPMLVAAMITGFGLAEGLALTGLGIAIMGTLMLPLRGTLAMAREEAR